MTIALYNLPRYYDVGFAWDPSAEINTLHAALDAHLEGPADHLLEPGCGTGRLLLPLAMYGHRLTGYDNRAAMLRYTADKVRGAGVAERVDLVRTDFLTRAFAPRFDAAFNFIGSIGHLLLDAHIVRHLRATAAALRPGGLYVVQLALLWEDQTEYEPYDFTNARDDISVTVHWEIESVDVPRRCTAELSRLTVVDAGQRFTHTDRYPMRLWLYDDWIELIHASAAFDLVGVYDECGEVLDLREPVGGEDGNCYYVLRRR